jgi:hypothetical protein
MLSKQEEAQERREVLENDRLLREQQKASTFHQHAQAQADETAQGRFRATGTPRVIGSTPSPAAQYPAASSAHQTELPREEPLGYSVDAMSGLENPADVSVVSPSAEPGGAAAPSVPPRMLSRRRLLFLTNGASDGALPLAAGRTCQWRVLPRWRHYAGRRRLGAVGSS